MKNKKEKKQEFKFEYNGTNYLIAKGGLHNVTQPCKIIPNVDEVLISCDVSSMYPNAISKRKLFPKHLGEEWWIAYSSNIQRRLDAKKKFKETKDSKYDGLQAAFKLILNGNYGKIGEESNWQYDPFVMCQVTIGCQIELLMLIEQLEIAGIHVIIANTDGLECLLNRSLVNKYYEICKLWEKQVNSILEYCEYKEMYLMSVNDYIAIKSNGEIKKKGDFVTDFELYKNKSARIIPLALEQYFVNKISVGKTITEHQNIFDFCLGNKSIGKNKLVAFNKKDQTEKELQKINRYYISNDGFHLLKRLPKLENKKAKMQLDIFGKIDDGTRESEIEAGWLSIVYNRHIKRNIEEYDINYQYYIKRCNKIINQIEKC